MTTVLVDSGLVDTGLVDVVVEDSRWVGLGLEALAERAAKAAFRTLDLAGSGYVICVMGCDDARIAGLNADFRGKPTATNVLSWPSEDRAAGLPGQPPKVPQPGEADDPLELGDVALSYDTCLAEAAAQGKPAADHVTHLIIHGVLHVLGYDHETDADATLMEGIETRALADLGISNPY